MSIGLYELFYFGGEIHKEIPVKQINQTYNGLFINSFFVFGFIHTVVLEHWFKYVSFYAIV